MKKPITIEKQPFINVFLQVLALVFDNDIDRMIQFLEEKGSEEQKETDLPIALEYKRDMENCKR